MKLNRRALESTGNSNHGAKVLVHIKNVFVSSENVCIARAYHKYAADPLENLFLIEGKFLPLSLFHSLLLQFLQSIHFT